MSDAEIDEAISGWTAACTSASAHRLLFIGEKAGRNYNDDWEILEDTEAAWNSAAAEVSLASGISHGRASGDMEIGLALASRLPRTTALLLDGVISERIARRIVFRTALIQDPDLLARVDAAIAEAARQWGTLSAKKLDAAIDVWVDLHDPGALRNIRVRVRDRGVEIVETKDGVTEIVLRLKGPDAALFFRRVSLMAKGVCKDDPRTLQQRLADACGALGAGSFQLACDCGKPDCDAAGVDDGRASSFVVNIYAEAATLTARPDPYMDGDGPIPDADTEQPAPSNRTAECAAPDEAADDSVADAGASDEQASEQGSTGGQSAAPAAVVAAMADVFTTEDDVEEDSTAPAAATQSDVAAAADRDLSAGDNTAAPPQPNTAAANPDSTRFEPHRAKLRRPPPGILPDIGHIPAEEIAARINAGATVRHLKPPGIEPEPQYRPRIALADWVKARDLTCRFPNCDRPAETGEFDHTVPWPAGPTHASGGKMYLQTAPRRQDLLARLG